MAATDNLILSTPALAAYGGANAALTGPVPTISGTGHDENAFAYSLSGFTLDAYGGLNASLTLPTPTLSITGTQVNYGAGAIALPTPTLSASGTVSASASAALTFGKTFGTYSVVGYSGAVSSLRAPKATLSASLTVGGVLHADLVAPSATLTGYSGATAKLALPSAVLTTAATSGTVAHAALKLPGFTLVSYAGANARLTGPSATLTGTATIGAVANAALTAPSATISSGGGSAYANLTFLSTYSLVGYSGAICSVTLTDGFTITSGASGGGVAKATLTLPLYELTAVATAQNWGGADLLMPAAQLGGQAQAWLVMPGATLTAIGHAVVTVAYEAYAVNLNHKPAPGQAPIDETTRYTNYPFTQIVRYKNSYFGVAADGLYLLEGPTDVSTPIPYEARTTMTDFNITQQKTVTQAVFGGRIGPAATVKIYVGESGSDMYSYTTPRTTTAQNYRQAFGRGLKARYYAFGVSGTDTFELDTLTLDVQNMTRRI